jgi:hypothetical protein
MSFNLEQSSGLTANFGNAVYANSAGANAQVSTTTATTISTAGVISNFAIRAAAVFASLNDANTGALPVALVPGKAAVVVAGVLAGALAFVQGPVVPYPVTGVGNAICPLPSIPVGFVPIAYQVVKNPTGSATPSFQYGTSNFNATGVTFDVAVQVCQLPNFGITNVLA